MSDTFLNHARNAFAHHDWAALIQYVRDGLPQDKSRPSMYTPSSSGSTKVSDPSSSEHIEMVKLAVQSLPLVDFQTRWELVSLITKFGPIVIEPLVSLLDQFQSGALEQRTDVDLPGPNPDRSVPSPVEQVSNIHSAHRATIAPPYDEDDEDDADWDLLWFIARILGNIQHSDAIAALIKVLQTSPSEDVVTAAIMALAQQGMDAIAPLTQLLNHGATKLLATQALAQIFAKDPSRELRDTLMTITQDVDPSVRTVVIEALSHSHQPQVTDILLEASKDVASRVRRAAIIGLGIQAKVCDSSIIPMILENLEPRLWDVDTEVRRQTAIALGRIQTIESAKLLFTALIADDFPSMLKPDVVRALIWTNTQAGLDILSEYLRDHHPKAPVYQEIAVMLGRVESPKLHHQATQILLDLLVNHGLTQQSVIIKQSIAMSLGQLKQPQSEAVLVDLSQDDDERVKLHAIAALKTLKNAWEA